MSILLLALFITGSTLAEVPDYLPAEPRVDWVEAFRRNGMRIAPHGKCAEILRGAEADLGRRLTRAEIEADLDTIMAETGECLVFEDRGDWGCFTQEMRVATPRGPVRIASLKAGDAVLSFDVARGRVVRNVIADVHRFPNRRVGQLDEHRLTVTESHPFFTFDGYHPIGTLPAATLLARQDQVGIFGVSRGAFTPLPNRRTVWTLQLEGEPRNFFVQGILVHNKPWEGL